MGDANGQTAHTPADHASPPPAAPAYAATISPPRKLSDAIAATGACVSVGLEPHPDRLPAGVHPSLDAIERYLVAIIDAAAPLVPAFKPNLAFFEALGPDGWTMLHRVRERIPADRFVIADAKRGDIGSSAERYATALFDALRADAVTVNPLMGRDAVEPFLAREGTLAYILCLTSNPGAADFLHHAHLDRRIAEHATRYRGPASRGLVVGATADPARLHAIADAAPGLPLLVPGVGAQGGVARPVIDAFGDPRTDASLFHATRAVLPDPESAPPDHEQYAETVARLVASFVERISRASEGEDNA